MAQRFAIASREEAVAYLGHGVLGSRLKECTALITAVQGRTVREILGSPDDLKFQSSMTLFGAVLSDPEFFPANAKFSGESQIKGRWTCWYHSRPDRRWREGRRKAIHPRSGNDLLAGPQRRARFDRGHELSPSPPARRGRHAWLHLSDQRTPANAAAGVRRRGSGIQVLGNRIPSLSKFSRTSNFGNSNPSETELKNRILENAPISNPS